MRYTIIYFITIFISQIAGAQTCFWKTNKNSFYVGDKLVATLIIPEIKLKQDPLIKNSNAIHFNFLEKNSIESEGKRTTFYRYQIIPIKGGIQHFPQVTFPSHKKLLCDAFSIHVKVPERNPNLKLEVKLSTKQCYLHQPIDLTFTWKSAIPLGNLKAVIIDMPFFNQNNFKVYVPTSSVTIPKGKIGLPVSGNRIIADITDMKIDKIPYKVMSFKLTVVPETSGIIEIEPSSLLCSYIKQKSSFNAYPAYFDNNLFDQEDNSKYTRLITHSQPIKLEVKELPSENRPANFSGLFGEFDAKLKLDKQEVKTGEPIQLQLEVRNYQHPKAFHLPDFKSLLPNKELFRYTQAEPSVSSNDSLIAVKKRIRINTVDLEKFPSIRIPYFDCKKEEFAYVETDAKELQVLQGENSPYQPENDTINQIKKYQVALNANGINQLYTNIDALSPKNESWNLWFWIILVVFPIIFWVYDFFQKMYANPDYIRKQKIKKATKEFSKRDYNNSKELEEGISLFFNQAFNIESKLIVPQRIQNTININCPGADIRPIISFYTEYYKKQYSDNESKDEVQAKSIKVCINQISKLYLRK